ncbi:MAG: hypothetical protein NT080_06615 [Spirochaetes bacterium]|nr:hypothetical protein [Spirochaetota bacterium]
MTAEFPLLFPHEGVSDGFGMTKAGFAKYFDGLLRSTFANPRDVLHGSHYHFFVLHTVLAELTLLVLPFSKVVYAFLSLPLKVLRRNHGFGNGRGAQDPLRNEVPRRDAHVPGNLLALRALRESLPRVCVHAGSNEGHGECRKN